MANLKLLRLKEMVSISAPWLGPQKPVFLSIPQIAGLFGDVEKVHQQAAEQQAITEADERVAALTDKLHMIDASHDRMLRTVWFGLSASIEFLLGLEVPRADLANRLEGVRARLLPERLAYIQKGYLEEAGIAEALKKQLTPELEAVLASVPVVEGSVLEAVRRWIELGAWLGELERQRLALTKELGLKVSDAQARTAWARVVKTLLANLELASEPRDAIEVIRQPLLEALAKATERAAREKAAHAKEAEGAGEPS